MKAPNRKDRENAKHARRPHCWLYTPCVLLLGLTLLLSSLLSALLLDTDLNALFRTHFWARVGMVASTEAPELPAHPPQVLIFYDPSKTSEEGKLQLWRLAYHYDELTASGAQVFGVALAEGENGAQLDPRLPFPWPTVYDRGHQLARHYAVDVRQRGPVVLLLDTEGVVKLRARPHDMYVRIEADIMTALAAVNSADRVARDQD